MNIQRRRETCRPQLKQQQGMALVIGLIMLLVLTVLGVATMRNTTLQERMSANVQQSMLAFQSAEVGVNNMWNIVSLQSVSNSQSLAKRVVKDGETPTLTANTGTGLANSTTLGLYPTSAKMCDGTNIGVDPNQVTSDSPGTLCKKTCCGFLIRSSSTFGTTGASEVHEQTIVYQ